MASRDGERYGQRMDLVPLLIAAFIYAIGLIVLYFVIRAAVRGGLSDHYKTVRAFEATGKWSPGNHGDAAPTPLDELKR
jgi:hypothetical protein